MRVLLVQSTAPFVGGGARQIVDWTADELEARGHQVDRLDIPFPTTTRDVMSALVGMRALPVEGVGDRLIAFRWPAHVVRHDNKATWFIHHHRVLFDLWDGYRDVPDDHEGWSYRAIVRDLDCRTLKESRAVFSNSAIVSDRLRRYNAMDVRPLYPPLGGELGRFGDEGAGDTIVFPSRVTRIKRQALAVEAMRHVRSDVRLAIVGRPESPQLERDLRRRVAEWELEDRVDLFLEWVPEQRKAELLRRALAVAYLPRDEDSYGYPSLEASHCSKPIVTTSDGGGSLEFVRDGIEGLVAAPDARSLAAAFDRLRADVDESRAMGRRSHDRRAELGITWDHVIPHLLGTSP